MNSLSRSILVVALYALSSPRIAAAQRDPAVKTWGAELAAAAPSVKEPAPAAPGNDLRRLAPGTVFRDCSECPEMVVIPSGRFAMGSPDSESGRLDRKGPVHSVAIRSAFGASNRRDRAIPARHPGQSREKE